jgi:hypothetical protein
LQISGKQTRVAETHRSPPYDRLPAIRIAGRTSTYGAQRGVETPLGNTGAKGKKKTVRTFNGKVKARNSLYFRRSVEIVADPSSIRLPHFWAGFANGTAGDSRTAFERYSPPSNQWRNMVA